MDNYFNGYFDYSDRKQVIMSLFLWSDYNSSYGYMFILGSSMIQTEVLYTPNST